MVSKVLFCIFAGLLSVQLTFASPDLCPDPNTAKNLAQQETIQEAAPSFGRTEKVVTIPSPDNTIPSCIVLNGVGGSTSITAVGISKEKVILKLVSGIKQPIEGTIEVYTE